MLGLRAAGDEAAGQLGEAERRCQRAERELADAAEDEDAARQVLAEALARLREVDAAAAETSGRLGTLAGAAKAAQDEAGRLAAAIATAERAREKDLAQLADLQGRLTVQEAESTDGSAADAEDGDEGPGDKNALAAQATAARNAEMEARLDVRTVEERLRAVAGRGRRARLGRRGRAPGHPAGQGPDRSGGPRQAAVASAVADGARLALAAIERSSDRGRRRAAGRRAGQPRPGRRAEGRSGPGSGSSPPNSTRW